MVVNLQNGDEEGSGKSKTTLFEYAAGGERQTKSNFLIDHHVLRTGPNRCGNGELRSVGSFRPRM